jgi:hypothetical protein
MRASTQIKRCSTMRTDARTDEEIGAILLTLYATTRPTRVRTREEEKRRCAA